MLDCTVGFPNARLDRPESEIRSSYKSVQNLDATFHI